MSAMPNPAINWAARNLSLEYKNFEEMCELMFKGPLAEKCKDDASKFSFISLWSGTKGIELFRNSNVSETRTPSNLLKVLKAHCQPSDQTFWASRMEMRNLSQRSGETFSDFSNRTCTIANECGWSSKDEQIVCALIFGASHKEAQRTALLKSKDLKVSDCVAHFTSYEVNDKQQIAIKASTCEAESLNVDKISNNNYQADSKFVCWFCGTLHPRRNCPAYGHICKKCSYPNHYEHKCQNKSDENKQKHYKNDKQSKYQKRSVYNVEVEQSDNSEEEDLYCLTINETSDSSNEICDNFSKYLEMKGDEDFYGYNECYGHY